MAQAPFPGTPRPPVTPAGPPTRIALTIEESRDSALIDEIARQFPGAQIDIISTFDSPPVGVLTAADFAPPPDVPFAPFGLGVPQPSPQEAPPVDAISGGFEAPVLPEGITPEMLRALQETHITETGEERERRLDQRDALRDLQRSVSGRDTAARNRFRNLEEDLRRRRAGLEPRARGFELARETLTLPAAGFATEMVQKLIPGDQALERRIQELAMEREAQGLPPDPIGIRGQAFEESKLNPLLKFFIEVITDPLNLFPGVGLLPTSVIGRDALAASIARRIEALAPRASAESVREAAELTGRRAFQILKEEPGGGAPFAGFGPEDVDPVSGETARRLAGVPEPRAVVRRAEDIPAGGADNPIQWFTDFLHSPDRADEWTLTQKYRQEALAGRAVALQARVEQLLLDGVPAEEAISRATKETLAGKLPTAPTGFQAPASDEVRAALFDRVRAVLADQPFEMISTAEALRNALLGKPIPRKPGVAGGSAFTRLVRVFPKEIVDALDKRQTLAEIIALRGKGLEPTNLEIREYLRNLPSRPAVQARLGEEAIDLNELRLVMREPLFGGPLGGDPHLPTPSTTTPRSAFQQEMDLQAFKVALAGDVPGVDPALSAMAANLPPDGATRQLALMPLVEKNKIITALKAAGLTIVDIGNLMRANMASFDMSFWRQQAPLIFGNFKEFMGANADAFRALWTEEYALGVMRDIRAHPYFRIYERIVAEGGGDFIRPLDGTVAEAWQRAEDFLILGEGRPIPKIAEKLPWIRISARAHVTGTNSMNWNIFTNYVDTLMKINQQVAAGTVKLKPGEVFDVIGSAKAFSKMLADMSGRGPVGPLKTLTPALNAGFFSVRLNLGRLLAPRHLVSADPLVRKQAWKNFTTFISGMSGIILSGEMAGLWEVEKDRRSADFMKIRIGKVRVDPWGGFQQFLTFFSRILPVVGGGKSSETGQPFEVDPYMATARLLRGKASPLAGVISDFWTGKTFLGDDVGITNKEQWIERITPFALRDMVEAFAAEGWSGAVAGGSAFFGAGVLVYDLPRWPELDEYYQFADTVTPDGLTTETAAAKRKAFRIENPANEAKLFVRGQITTLSTERAKIDVLIIMADNNLQPEDVRGYEKVFGVPEEQQAVEPSGDFVDINSPEGQEFLAAQRAERRARWRARQPAPTVIPEDIQAVTPTVAPTSAVEPTTTPDAGPTPTVPPTREPAPTVSPTRGPTPAPTPTPISPEREQVFIEAYEAFSPEKKDEFATLLEAAAREDPQVREVLFTALEDIEPGASLGETIRENGLQSWLAILLGFRRTSLPTTLAPFFPKLRLPR